MASSNAASYLGQDTSLGTVQFSNPYPSTLEDWKHIYNRFCCVSLKRASLTAKHVCVSLLKNSQRVPRLCRDPSPGIKERHPSEKGSKSRGKVPSEWAAAFLLKQGVLSRLRHGLLTHGLIFLKPPDAKTSFSCLCRQLHADSLL